MPERFDIRILEQGDAWEIGLLLDRCPDIEPRRYRDGEYLIRENEEDRDLFILVKGGYTVEHPPLLPGGPPVILASGMCDPERIAIVGEMAYFGDYLRTASVRSSGSTYALCLKPAHIEVIMDGYPLLTRALCRQFTKRLKDANEVIREFRRKFALAVTKRMLQAGERLFAAGDPPDAIHQLLAGTLELDRAGRKTCLTHDAAFQGFLEPEAYFRKRPYEATAVAQTDCIVVSVDQAHKETLVRCYPELASRVLEG
jgi:CRP-like cAMP-binding protein